MIETACKAQGLTIDGWQQDDDYAEPRPEAVLGEWSVVDDDESRGMYAGDTGTLTASVVGGVQYHNEQVKFFFTPEGMDGGEEVNPLDELEPV